MRSCSTWVQIAVILMLTACESLPSAHTAGGPPELFTQVQTLGGSRIIPRLGGIAQPTKINAPDYLPWLSLTAVRGSGNFLYLVDSGRGHIFQYDRVQQGMFVFANIAKSNVTAIDVASDMSMYVADANAHKVMHFSWDGKLLQTFKHDRELSRPVAIIADNATGQVLVADSLYNQVVVFSSLGRLLAVIRTPQTHSIVAMANGPDGLYLVDSVNPKVVVVRHDGLYRYTVGAGTLKMPNAIAVDGYNRVFVSDHADNTIKVYQEGHLIATLGGTGATPGRFNHISDLWLDRNILQVVDRITGRLQTFMVAPPSKN